MVDYIYVGLLISLLVLMFFLVLNTVLFQRLLLARLDLLLDAVEIILRVRR
jgi:hypothetical protein